MLFFSVLPPLAAILLLGFVLCRALRVDAAFGPFLSVGCITLALLAFGSLNLLWPGRLAVYLAVAALGVRALRKGRGALKGYLLSPGVLIFALGALAFTILYVARDAFYYAWDDYSHWGPFFKSVYQTDRLHIFTGREMIHQSYPQGTTVLYYFYALLAPGFSEAHTYVVMGVLLTACTACLLAGATWKTPVATGLRIACVPLFFTLFPYADSYATVYHDTALGGVFGAALLLILMLDLGAWRHTAACMVGIAMVGQIKEVGFLLGLGCVALYAARRLLAGQKPLGKALKANAGGRGWLQILAVAVACLGPYLGWKAVLHFTGTTDDQFANPLQHDFFGRVSAALRGEDEIVASIWERFVINFRTMPVVYNGYGTPLFACLAFTAFAVVFGVWLWRRKQERGGALTLWLMPFFFAAYLFALFYTYVCMMTQQEGLLNMSYERYVSSFLIGWCMLALGAVWFYGSGFLLRAPGLLPVASATLVVALLLNGNLRHDRLNLKHTAANAGRPGFDHVSAQMAAAVPAEQRIWLVAQGDDGMYKNMFHYTLLPAEVAVTMPYTLGQEGTAADYTPAGLLAQAQENRIAYMLVYIPDEAFVEKYGGMFSDGVASVLNSDLPSLYKINYGSPVPFELLVATSLP